MNQNREFHRCLQGITRPEHKKLFAKGPRCRPISKNFARASATGAQSLRRKYRRNRSHDPRRGIFRSLPKNTPRGLADILAVKDGGAVFIEVKDEKRKQSDDQLAFQKSCVLAGAEYVVLKRAEDVQRVIH